MFPMIAVKLKRVITTQLITYGANRLPSCGTTLPMWRHSESAIVENRKFWSSFCQWSEAARFNLFQKTRTAKFLKLWISCSPLCCCFFTPRSTTIGKLELLGWIADPSQFTRKDFRYQTYPFKKSKTQLLSFPCSLNHLWFFAGKYETLLSFMNFNQEFNCGFNYSAFVPFNETNCRLQTPRS